MQRRVFNCAAIRVAHTTDMSGTATADEINRGLRTGKRRKLWRIACSTYLWSLMVAGLLVALAPSPANADNDKDSRQGHEDNDKEIRAEITALKAQVADLQNQVTTLQNQFANAKNVLALDPFVKVDPNPEIGVIGPNITFSGANIHIVSGSGRTDDNGNPLGLGNLIIGYDDDPQTLFAGGPGGGPPLRPGDRGGSHNLVIGGGNRFTQAAFGGLVAGELNTINGFGASVTGGRVNTASGEDASVSGGIFNTASAGQSSVSGGIRNIASGGAAIVTGGLFNRASGQGTVVIGGQEVGDNNNYSIAPKPPFP